MKEVLLIFMRVKFWFEINLSKIINEKLSMG